jgi:PAS domain S-box-containing protein
MSTEERLSVLADGGEMGALMRAFDWASAPIGPSERWPQSLRTTLQLMLSSQHPMLIWWGADLIQFYNDAFRQTLGTERHPSGLGQPARKCWAENWELLGPQVDQVMSGKGGTWDANQRVLLTRHGSGQPSWWTFGFNPIRDAQNGIGGVMVICNDVTEQHLATSALRESEERLARLRETLEDQIALRTRERDRLWRLSRDMLAVATLGDSRIIAVNPAWTTLLGLTAEAIVGRSVRDLVHPEDLAQRDEAAAHLSEGEPVSGETRLRHADGTYRWFSWSAVPEGGVMYTIGRDVTREHEAAEALQRAEAALRQSQKMEAIGQLSGGIAHDFNNLLQGIGGALDLIGKRVRAGRVGEVDRLLTAATTSTERAAELTHRLLAFSRRQPLDPRPLQANPLIDDMADMLRRTLGERIEVELALAPEAWPALCDRNQLESAILNVVINARDAMPEGGVLGIRTDNAHLEAEGDSPAGDFVCLSVSDTGRGMGPDVVARAVEPFFTTKPMGRGTGLGLSMTYGFIRQSGGRIDIDSRRGQGTTVRLCLPRHVGAVEVAEAPAAAPLTAAGHGEVVLVVDDDTLVRVQIVEALGELGFRTLQADDGPSGLQMLQSAERIDFLVTDVGLPGVDGRQVASAARKARPDLKVLFITGYAQNAIGGDLHLEEGMELLTKPFALEVLTARVCSMIENGRALV